MMQGILAIVRKELLALLRTRRAFTGMFVLLLMAAAAYVPLLSIVSGVGSLEDRARLSRVVLFVLTGVFILGFGLLAVVTGSAAIAGERESRTFGLLAGTPLRPIQIVLGKWLSVVGYLLLVLVLSAPMLAISFMLGGISIADYLACGFFVAESVLAFSMFALALSALFRRTLTALFGSLVLLGAFMFGPFLLNELLTEFGVYYTEVAFAISPFLSWIKLLDSLARGLQTTLSAGLQAGPGFVLHVGVQGAMFMFALLLATLGWRRAASERGLVAAPKTSSPKELRRRGLRWPFYLIDPLRAPQDIADGANPAYVKELRTSPPARARTLIRLSYLTVGVSLLIALPAVTDPEGFGMGLSLWVIGVIMLVTPALTAASVSRERVEGTFDLLVTSGLSPARILWGKLRVSLRVCAVIALGLLTVPSLAYATLGPGPLALLGELAPRIPFIAGFSLLFSVLGLWQSAAARRNTAAVISTYTLVWGLSWLSLVVIGIQELLDHAVGELGLTWLAPLSVGSLLVLKGFWPLVSPFYCVAGEEDWIDPDSPLHHWYLGEGGLDLAGGIVHTCLMLALCGFIFRLALRRFTKLD